MPTSGFWKLCISTWWTIIFSCLCSSMYFATAFLYARAFVCSPVYRAWMEWLEKITDSVYEDNLQNHLAIPKIDQEFFISWMGLIPWCETRTFRYLKALSGFYTYWAFLWDTGAKNSVNNRMPENCRLTCVIEFPSASSHVFWASFEEDRQICGMKIHKST